METEELSAREVNRASEAPKMVDQTLDVEKYRPYLAEFDLTEEQQRELLETLFTIMVAFVDLGFGVNSIHDLLPGLDEIDKQCDANRSKLETEDGTIGKERQHD